MKKDIGKTDFINYLKDNQIYHLVFASFIIITLVLITYWKAPKNNFVDWDDFGYVVNNKLVRDPGERYLKDLFTTPIASNYHPVTILSMRLNNNICEDCPDGISPGPFIRGNITIHLFNSILVLIFIFLLSKKNLLASFVVAAIFAVHPMHVESVAWISERKDVLYSFFFLSGLILYIWYKRTGRLLLLAATFLVFILSCLSKAQAVVFPVILILIDFWSYSSEDKNQYTGFLKYAFSFKNLSALLPFFIVSVIVGLMALRIQSGQNFLGFLDLSKNTPDVVNEIGPFTIWQRFEIAGYGFLMYILKFVYPVNLIGLYPYPTLAELNGGSFKIILLLSLFLSLLVAILTIFSLKKTRLYAFGIGFYFITLALVLQFISVGMAIMADRYSYLPYIGIAFVPAILLTGKSRTLRTWFGVISGIFIIILVILAKNQVKVWQNTETLWTNVIDKHPDLELPLRSRGKYYSKKSTQAKSVAEKKMLEDKALADFMKAIKAGTKSADVFEGTGIIYSIKGDTKNAIVLLNKAISINPKKGSAYYNRAMIYDKMNQKDEAIKDYNMALIYKQESVFKILNNRSNLLLETGRFREAILDYDYLISIDNKNFYYYYNRAYAKLMQRDLEGAIEDYSAALKLKPDDEITRKRLEILTTTSSN